MFLSTPTHKWGCGEAEGGQKGRSADRLHPLPARFHLCGRWGPIHRPFTAYRLSRRHIFYLLIPTVLLTFKWRSHSIDFVRLFHSFLYSALCALYDVITEEAKCILFRLHVKICSNTVLFFVLVKSVALLLCIQLVSCEKDGEQNKQGTVFLCSSDLCIWCTLVSLELYPQKSEKCQL